MPPQFNIDATITPTGAETGAARFDAAAQKMAGAGRQAEAATASLTRQIEALRREVDPLYAAEARLADVQSVLTAARREGLVTETEALQLARAMGEQLAQNAVTFETVLAELQEETALMKLSNSEREKRQRLMAIEADLAERGLQISAEERLALQQELEYQQALARAKETTPPPSGGLLAGAGSKAGAAIAGAFAVGEIVHLGDAYISLQNRLKLVTSSTEELSRVTSELYDVAQETRTGWEETTELYQRLSNATKELGISEERRLALTKEINQLSIESGVSSQEAANGIRQLAQGLAAGTLHGQDLRAALEDIPALGQAIAKGLGVSVGQLRQLGEDGKLTAQSVLGALERVQDETDANFKKTDTTFEQSMVKLKNALIQLAAVLTPIINALAGAIGFVADHLETVGVIAGGLALGPLGTLGIAAYGAGKAIGALADALGIGGDLMDSEVGKALKLQQEIDAMTDSIDASTASFRTWTFLARDGVNVQAVAASVNVHNLANAIRETTKEMVYAKDAIDIYTSQVKDFTRDTIREIDRLRQEQKQQADEAEQAHKKLVEDLDRLIAKESAAATAAKELAEANRILTKSVEEHLITQEKADEVRAATIANIAAEQLAKDKLIDTYESFDEVLKREAAIQEANRQAIGNDLKEQAQELKNLNDQIGAAPINDLKKLADELRRIGTERQKLADQGNLEKGFVNALRKIGEEASKTGDQLEKIMVGAVNRIEDSLVELAVTGKHNFEDLVSDILKQLTKLLLNQALTALFNLGTPDQAPVGGGVLGALVGSGKTLLYGGAHATGGSFTAPPGGGTDSILMFAHISPRENVSFTPAGQAPAQGAAPPIVHVDARPHITNIVDPRLIDDHLETPQGERAVLNVLARNAVRARAVLGVK